MDKIHVRNQFRICITLDRSLGTAITRTDPFGFDMYEYGFSFNIKLAATDHYGNVKHEPENCFTWAKRNPVICQKDECNSINTLFICLKINQGVFDFRRTKDRMFKLIIEFFENGNLVKTGTSRMWELFPKRRRAQRANEDIEIVPVFWIGEDGFLDESRTASDIPFDYPTTQISPIDGEDVSLQSVSETELKNGLIILSSAVESEGSTSCNEFYYDEDIIGVNEHSTEENQLSILPQNNNAFDATSEEHYMVLYNGNAEVVGNFRALNFYKASDVNIKDDIRLLVDDHDCRASLLRINGVSYKFKPGMSAATNKRFIGYIAQQIETIVPEAVQLIDALIPYMSESIKQNYNDMQHMKSEVDRVKIVVDILYEQFTKTSVSNSPNLPKAVARRKRSMIIGVIVVSALVISMAIGLIFFMNRNDQVTNPTTHVVPIGPTPFHGPSAPVSDEKRALIDLFRAVIDVQRAAMNFTSPHCSWPGISCNSTTGHVIGVRINARDDYFSPSTYPSIPASIGNLTELQSLDLSRSSLLATIPSSITRLKQLELLSLSGNQLLMGTVPNLSNLTNLKELYLFDTALSLNEDSLAALMNLPRIERLNLSGLKIKSTLPDTMSESLTLLNLTGCTNLYGTIPKAWEDSNVKYLYIGLNLLTGPLPCLGKNIESFEAWGARLEGEFCGTNFTKIKDLDLAWTNLIGPFDLPNTNISQMISLKVDSNQLTSFMQSHMNDTIKGPFDCSTSGNNFKCPIPNWSKILCGATCV